MSAIIIIPARMASSRFPGKPMASINGIPMIEHCYLRASLTKGVIDTYVATCDNEIYAHIESIGGKSILTDIGHTRATTRVAEAVEKIELLGSYNLDIVVMVQGDEPLVSPVEINKILDIFEDPSVEIVNLMCPIDSLEKFIDKNNVKVTIDKSGNALYFSREPIPSPWRGFKLGTSYMQTGVIAFRKSSLKFFNELSESMLEEVESIDMNRVLENGGRIRMHLTNNIMIGVDTREELMEVERILTNQVSRGNPNE